MPSLPVPIFGAVVLLFLFARLWVARGRLSLLGGLLLICAVQSAIIALAQHYSVPGLRLVQPVTATLIPPFAWIAFQTTAVRSLEKADALHLLIPASAIAALLTGPQFLDILIPTAFFAYGLAILVKSLKGSDTQPRAYLGNGEMPSRIWLAIGAVLMASAFSDVLIVSAIGVGLKEWKPWIVSLFSTGNLIVIGLFSLSGYLETDESGQDDTPQRVEQADTATWEAVQNYMAEKRPYLDPDLTLAKLSRRLGIPAKTISKAINQATGENVSRFVNTARIEAAQAKLLEGENVTAAMLASGFNTKSNFNREFLRVTGTSPSKWLALRNR